MGKYMRKEKLAGEIAVMEITHQPTLGVRTRARTLALQRLRTSASPAHAPAPAAEPGAGSYLQLRSRRLEKPPAVASRPKDGSKDGSKSGAGATPRAAPEAKNPKPRAATCSANYGSVGSASAEKRCSKKAAREKQEPASEVSLGSEGVEASFGENVLELEGRDRSVRETTPCSLMRDSEITGTPGSTTKPRIGTSSNGRTRNTRGDIPTREEMEMFFASAEQLQQRVFTEKYNFDPVKDCPLPGRYEWIRLDC